MPSSVPTKWEKDLLKAYGGPDTANNVLFLTAWVQANKSKCAHNPLLANVKLGNSSHCKQLDNGFYAQSYHTRKLGIQATVAQLKQPYYAGIRAALASGNPYTFKQYKEVVTQLRTWGSPKASRDYEAVMQPAGGHGKRGSAFHAYHHLAQTLAHDVPTSLSAAAKLNKASLARLKAKG